MQPQAVQAPIDDDEIDLTETRALPQAATAIWVSSTQGDVSSVRRITDLAFHNDSVLSSADDLATNDQETLALILEECASPEATLVPESTETTDRLFADTESQSLSLAGAALASYFTASALMLRRSEGELLAPGRPIDFTNWLAKKKSKRGS